MTDSSCWRQCRSSEANHCIYDGKNNFLLQTAAGQVCENLSYYACMSTVFTEVNIMKVHPKVLVLLIYLLFNYALFYIVFTLFLFSFNVFARICFCVIFFITRFVIIPKCGQTINYKGYIMCILPTCLCSLFAP